ncbi:PREDICTED: uncharacterized protein LOC104816240 [Tarenaya hassleriana]|uniref:uncharacterized protein LOC104816240 n=1 Tax=Tarenaya hassleriana TaxID=28532 RepID=UPI00053C5B11|nr:PREDICTED: uncharacterized protein LOC104816240 [Tarenaya hassleriana]XP_010543259.1 PREDICTED: uncharacterized protein LOC104816240 [Tarenaya hassleriana]
MALRTELRGVLKQSQRATKIADGKEEEKRRDTDNEIPLAGSDVSGQSRKECVTESFKRDDELIKYMSKLPDYLQREERRGKALNIGVLDWGSLEKWKHGQKCNNASSSGSDTSVKTDRNVSTRKVAKVGEQSATCSNLSNDHTCRVLERSVRRIRCTQEPVSVSTDSLNKQRKAGFGRKPSGSETQSSQDLGSSVCLDMGNSGASVSLKRGEVIDSVTDQPVRSNKLSLDSVDKQRFKNDGTRKFAGGSQEAEAGFAPRKQENRFGNVLLGSRTHTRSALTGEFLMSQDDNWQEAKLDEFSSYFVNGSKYSTELRCQIPCSLPLSLDFEKDSESIMAPLCVDLSSDKCTNELFGRKHLKTASKITGQEEPEEEPKRSRHPSPGKRFSFSFSRLSRSFSFKDDSAIQPLNSDDSVESDPVRFDGPPMPMNPEKTNMHTGVRASSLRRLLDPLLKAKGSENAKARSSSSVLKSTDNNVPLIDEKMQKDTSARTTRAFVQLTVRNGVPLFQFVVDDNSRSILGAIMNSSVSWSKDDSVRYCTFYSVDETKKKKRGSWLIRGNREKQRGFVYNMVGEMRLTEQKSRNHLCLVRESVLFESDQETEKRKSRREVAAVVMTEDVIGTETRIIIPVGVHGLGNEGRPSPLIERWRSNGICDCGGWDIGCGLRLLLSSQRRLFRESFQLLDQNKLAGFTMKQMEEEGRYRVEYDRMLLTPLQAFFISVTVITCEKEEEQRQCDEELSEQEKNKRSSLFNPPLSPVGRV